MACSACQKARQSVASNLSQGNVGGTIRAVTAGAIMAVEKMAGVDINKKYGVEPTVPSGKPYVRE